MDGYETNDDNDGGGGPVAAVAEWWMPKCLVDISKQMFLTYLTCISEIKIILHPKYALCQ